LYIFVHSFCSKSVRVDAFCFSIICFDEKCEKTSTHEARIC
jgi:hypothetical protein